MLGEKGIQLFFLLGKRLPIWPQGGEPTAAKARHQVLGLGVFGKHAEHGPIVSTVHGLLDCFERRLRRFSTASAGIARCLRAPVRRFAARAACRARRQKCSGGQADGRQPNSRTDDSSHRVKIPCAEGADNVEADCDSGGLKASRHKPWAYRPGSRANTACRRSRPRRHGHARPVVGRFWEIQS